MKRWFLLCSLICLLLSLLSPLPACGRRPAPIETLEAFAAAYPLPAGRLYDSEAEAGSPRYLSPTLAAAFLSRSPSDDDREDVRRFALFLGSSSSSISEMGVFECPDREAATEVFGCLRTRIDLCRRGAGAAAVPDDPHLCIYGRTVIYTLLPDNAKAARVLSRLL